MLQMDMRINQPWYEDTPLTIYEPFVSIWAVTNHMTVYYDCSRFRDATTVKHPNIAYGCFIASHVFHF